MAELAVGGDDPDGGGLAADVGGGGSGGAARAGGVARELQTGEERPPRRVHGLRVVVVLAVDLLDEVAVLAVHRGQLRGRERHRY